MKLDKTVKKETGIVLLGTVILSAVMVGIFALVGRFDYTVVTGALLGGLASVLNFFLMGLTVQSAVSAEKDAAKKKIQLSYTVRSFALVVLLGVGVYLPYFHWLPVLASALFPRITIFFRSIILKKQNADKGGDAE
ncbi:MAG: ATP synthase subunit I [Acutalibacteraceae bacterium]